MRLLNQKDELSAYLRQHMGAKDIASCYTIAPSTGNLFGVALTQVQELHLFIGGGFRTTPYAPSRASGSFTPGLGGETGIMADFTASSYEAFGDLSNIKAFWQASI